MNYLIIGILFAAITSMVSGLLLLFLDIFEKEGEVNADE